MDWIRPSQSVSSNTFPKAIISGFVAMVAMMLIFAAAYGVASALGSWGILGEVVSGWLGALVANQVIDLAANAFYLALAIHFVAGIAWALIYAYYFEPRLRGPGWLRGLTFSFVPWILSLVVFLPAVGGGMLGLSLGAGPLPIIGNLILHLVYGIVLGEMQFYLYHVGEFGNEEYEAESRSARFTAIGFIAGAVAGGIVGALIAVALIQTTQMRAILGLSPWFFTICSALIGASWVGLIASLVGYSSEQGHPEDIEEFQTP
jgi:hypothetical protein